jgi:alpha-mannosidase
MRPTYHFVSHAHWDREWYLTFEELRVRLVQMIDDLILYCDDHPQFHSFLFDGQADMIESYLEIKPEMRENISAYVRNGKFSIGPWYILTDQFLPSGESHIRNLQIGLKSAKRFGKAMMIGYIPDQFFIR